MNRQRIFSLLGFFCLLAVLFPLAATAGAEDIRERMAARLPEILALKDKGVLGEDSLGFLQFTGAVQEKADLVQAENEDRRQVYQAIAKQQGTTVELVGRRRAQQLMDIALPGHWLQESSGVWRKK